MGTYNWGGGALRNFHETVKDALNPELHHGPRQIRHLGLQVPRPGPVTGGPDPHPRTPAEEFS
jgi:hypothetical protein